MRALLFTLALAAGPVLAQETSVVQFEPGSSGAVINGAVVGNDYVDYLLGAAAGQTMTVDLAVTGTNGNGSAFFNIMPPGAEWEAIYVGSMDDDRSAEVTLPESGDYTIRVYLMGNDADTGKTVGYSIAVEIY